MNTRLIIGIIILSISCLLAFLIPRFWSKGNDCEGGICPLPTERRMRNMLDWYWIVAIIAAIAGMYWFFIR